MKKQYFLIAFAFVFAMACNNKSGRNKNAVTLSAAEKQLVESLKIDSTILLSLKTKTPAKLKTFEWESGFSDDTIAQKKFAEALPGFMFDEDLENVEEIYNGLHDEFKGKGYSLFTLEQNYGIGGEKDIMAVLKTSDKYAVLKRVNTDGINYDITNDSVIHIVQQFDQQCDLELVGAGFDWCEFKINKAPENWMKLAEEAYAVCPDIVDQGTGTVEALAEEMKTKRRLYFWWD